MQFGCLIAFLCVSAACGLLMDKYVFRSFCLNYLLIGMAFSATVANLVSEEKPTNTMALYGPLLNLSLVLVVVNLRMPLDFRLIAGAACSRRSIFCQEPQEKSAARIWAER